MLITPALTTTLASAPIAKRVALELFSTADTAFPAPPPYASYSL